MKDSQKHSENSQIPEDDKKEKPSQNIRELLKKSQRKGIAPKGQQGTIRFDFPQDKN